MAFPQKYTEPPHQPSPTGAHALQETPVTQSRFEHKIRRAFGKIASATPEAVDVMINLMNGAENEMVKLMAARFILQSAGLGEIQKSVQRTTSEIKMETRTVNPLDDALSRLSGPEADRLLARMEEDLRKLVSQQVSEQEREQPLLIEAEVREL